MKTHLPRFVKIGKYIINPDHVSRFYADGDTVWVIDMDGDSGFSHRCESNEQAAEIIERLVKLLGVLDLTKPKNTKVPE